MKNRSLVERKYSEIHQSFEEKYSGILQLVPRKKSLNSSNSCGKYCKICQLAKKKICKTLRNLSISHEKKLRNLSSDRGKNHEICRSEEKFVKFINRFKKKVRFSLFNRQKLSKNSSNE